MQQLWPEREWKPWGSNTASILQQWQTAKMRASCCRYSAKTLGRTASVQKTTQLRSGTYSTEGEKEPQGGEMISCFHVLSGNTRDRPTCSDVLVILLARKADHHKLPVISTSPWNLPTILPRLPGKKAEIEAKRAPFPLCEGNSAQVAAGATWGFWEEGLWKHYFLTLQGTLKVGCQHTASCLFQSWSHWTLACFAIPLQAVMLVLCWLLVLQHQTAPPQALLLLISQLISVIS